MRTLIIQHDDNTGPGVMRDAIEATGEITKVGTTSRVMRFEVRKVIGPRPDLSDSAADLLAEPVVVCRATGTCVVPKDKQRHVRV